MNKHTFLQRLEKALRHIPKEDREDAISYYTEYFEEMGADVEFSALDATSPLVYNSLPPDPNNPIY